MKFCVGLDRSEFHFQSTVPVLFLESTITMTILREVTVKLFYTDTDVLFDANFFTHFF